MDAIFSSLGVAAVVTRPEPNDTPIDASVIWVASTGLEPSAGEFQRRERKYLMAIPRDTVPEVPRGTRIVAAEREGDVERTWIVDATERVEVDETRVWVVPAAG